MIYSVYLNPTIDKTVYVEKFIYGGTNRPYETISQGGGKALNLAVILNRLGMNAHGVGFIGRENSQSIREAFSEISSSFVELSEPPRVNLKIVDRSNFVTTEINEKGPFVPEEKLAEFERLLLSLVKKEDLVVLTGALPRGCGADYYARLISLLPCRTALDASGEALTLAIREKPLVIKPNEDELEQLAGKKVSGTRNILSACKDLIQQGIKICLVTLGKEGALITDGKEAYFSPPLVENPDSTAGAGDSMLAGALFVLESGGSVKDALAMGTAAAAATISLPGSNLATKELTHQFLLKTKLTRLSMEN